MSTVVAPADPTVLFTGEGSPTEAGLHGTGNVFAPCVRVDGDRLRMWYGAQGADGHDRIHHADSPDGIHWERHGVVLEHPEDNLVNDPCVVRHGDGWRMYYTVAHEWIVDVVHLAESADGITWQRRGEVLGPGSPDAFDALLAGRPSVVRDAERWLLFYDGRRDFPPPLTQGGRWPANRRSVRRVAAATSIDGVAWQRPPAALGWADAGSVHVSRWRDVWVMLQESRLGTRLAVSRDLVAWTPARPLLSLSGSPWDRFGHITPFLHCGDGGPQVFLGLARRSSWTEQAMGVVGLPESALDEAVARCLDAGEL